MTPRNCQHCGWRESVAMHEGERTCGVCIAPVRVGSAPVRRRLERPVMDRVQAFMATQARAELSTIADGLGMPVYAVRRALKRLAEEGFVRMAQRRQGSHGGSVYERTGA